MKGSEMRCVDCSMFSFKHNEEMARQGFGTCKYREHFMTFSATRERDCVTYNPESKDVIDKRMAWLRGKK